MVYNLSKNQHDLLQLWQSLPKTSSAIIPNKSSLQTKHIAHILKDIGIAEWVGDNTLQILHVGTGVDTNFYGSMQARNAFDFASEDLKGHLNVHWNRLFAKPCGCIMTMITRKPERNAVELIGFHLPLCRDDGTPSFILSIYEKGDTIRGMEPNTTGLVAKEDISQLVYVDIGQGTPDHQDDFPIMGDNSPLSIV